MIFAKASKQNGSTFNSLRKENRLQKDGRKLEKDNSHKGEDLLRWFKSLLLQFMENLSDRESLIDLSENISTLIKNQ